MRPLAVLLAVSLIFTAAGCNRRAPSTPPARSDLGPDIAAPDPSVGCNMRVEAPWRGADGYSVRADAFGVTCPEAAISITIAGPNGSTRMAQSYQMEQLPLVFGTQFAALDRDGLHAALTRWIATNGAARRFARTSDLPEWERRQPAPRDTNYLYTPATGFSRAGFEALRAKQRPLFCYNAEGETLRCLALLPDGAVQLMVTARPAH